MYSICVKVHWLYRPEVKYLVLIAIKQDGIDESSRNNKPFESQEQAKDEFVRRIKSILESTGGKKENELL